MEFIECAEYRKACEKASGANLPWEKLKGASVMISGATGMIGSFLTDLIMYQNRNRNLGCRVIALGRNEEKAKKRFAAYWQNPIFEFRCCDINRPMNLPEEQVDYILHLASNTHPVAYATDPIGTITVNITGTYQLLEYAVKCRIRRFLFASSVEIYGENRGDVEKFTENYLGYIDCNTLRAGYPESKRAGEALCQAYIRQKQLDIVISRLSRTFGPTMLKSDSKALSQFLKNGIAGEDIVLKSEGTQFYSYTYVADAVTGLLFCLLLGENGQAYNIADDSCDITLRELAALIAESAGTQVCFELPDETERAGYSKATKAVMDGSKIESLGWKPLYHMQNGIEETMKILKEMD